VNGLFDSFIKNITINFDWREKLEDLSKGGLRSVVAKDWRSAALMPSRGESPTHSVSFPTRLSAADSDRTQQVVYSMLRIKRNDRLLSLKIEGQAKFLKAISRLLWRKQSHTSIYFKIEPSISTFNLRRFVAIYFPIMKSLLGIEMAKRRVWTIIEKLGGCEKYTDTQPRPT
jgi:hypothetical protein